jgi:hypothetical protein
MGIFFKRERLRLLFNNGIFKYLLYAVCEIILLVAGILIALQVNSWNEQRKLSELQQGYYQSIKEQLLVDRTTVVDAINYNTDKLKKFTQAYKIIASGDRTQLQLLAEISLEFKGFSDFRQRSNIYQALTSSGEIKFVANKLILKELQDLDSQYVLIERLEDIHRDIVIESIVPQLIHMLHLETIQIKDVDKFFDFPFQNTLYLTIGLFQEKDDEYQRAVGEIEQIIKLVEQEMAM